MDFRIEPVAEHHVEGLHAALDSIAREKHYLTMYEAPPLEDSRKFYLGNIKNGVPALVCIADGKVIGWCDLNMAGNRPALAHHATVGMGIIDGYREKGIGTALLATLIEAAKKKGLRHLYLEVYENNTRARALYRKLGFIETGRKPKFFLNGKGSYDDSIMMWLPLQDAGG